MNAIKIFEIDLEKYPNADFFSFVDKRIKMEPGEYILINIKNGGNSAIIACPKCGCKRPLKKRIGNNGHLVTFNDKSEINVTPSLDNSDGGCCDYHGYLNNGVFTGNL